MFQKARASHSKILSIFITAGFPKLESCPEIVRTLDSAGADLVEIGVPFSDPIADGPTIQYTSQKALENGINAKQILRQVETIRRESEIPIILMGYLNPIMKYGLEQFIQDGKSAGVDGLIIPDLIPEELAFLSKEFENSSLGFNFLVSPNTPTERVKAIDRLTSDFIYCVSVTGITGCRKGVTPELRGFLEKLRLMIEHPFLVGFGISNAVDAGAIAKYSDGIVIGSAILDLMTQHKQNGEMLKGVREFVNKIKCSLKGDENGN